MPNVFVLAGPNGAGKSTIASKLLIGDRRVEEFVNADAIAASIQTNDGISADFRAGRMMLDRLDALVAGQQDLGFETTLASRALLHRIVSPKANVSKVYEALLARDLRGDEQGIFASGSLLLDSETTPLAPAQLQVLQPRQAQLTLTEGRYHQVRRMFAAVGNHVLGLTRIRVGNLTLGDLPPGQWRALTPEEVSSVFA